MNTKSRLADQYKFARIMMVDDEPANLKLLDRMLTHEGYGNLVLIQDPRQVVTEYHKAPLDLILLDINMPFLNGYEVMEQLQALNDPLLPPIVVLTAQAGRDFLMKALEAGARDFISKPFDRFELLARVRNLLDAHYALRLTYQQKEILEELVQLRTSEVVKSRFEVVRRLGRAAEFRDNETGQHVMRMSNSCALLAKQIGLPPERCEIILHASPMHDIGKIGISDSILLKPGRLTPEERTIMETHVMIGANILDNAETDLLEVARIIALSHHEKWDGSGYPNQLAGEAIPIEGRIAAIADVFDALTSERPYKQAWPVEEAVANLKENAGSHFDPALIEAFLQILPEVLNVNEQFKDR
jgi:putative two-component system response regulator